MASRVVAVAAAERQTQRPRVVRASTFTADDRVWLLLCAAVVLGLCGLPYLVSAMLGPSDLERIGTFWFVLDFSQYAAAMHEGARSTGWWIHDHFSAEPHQAVLMYPLYVGSGKLATALGVQPMAIFTALEWLGRLGLITSVWTFASTFLQDRHQRRLAMILALGSLGLEAWMLPLRLLLHAIGAHGLADLLPSSIDIYLEMSSISVLLAAPHVMFGLALTLTCGVLYVRATAAGSPRARAGWLATLGLCTLGLSVVHPFNLPVLAAVLSVHALRSGRAAWPAAGVVVVGALPMMLYSLLVFQGDAFWSGTYVAQNLMPAPQLWLLPFDFGLVLVAAPLAWPVVGRWSAERRRLLLLWVGLGLVSMYAPVLYQRRFGFGVQPGLAVLAAVGLSWLNDWLRCRGWSWRRRLVNDALVVMAATTTTVIYLSLLESAARDQPTGVYLWSRAEAAAAGWLGARSSMDDVVLASTDFANPLAGAIDGRVVHGHSVATLHSAEKQALVQRFYAADATASERAQILATTGATVVALGPHAHALGAGDLGAQPGLRLVYDVGGVQLYRVEPGPPAAGPGAASS